MPRTFKDNERIKEERRAKILSTSLKLFATYGFDNVSMDMIAKKSKCSHGLMYHYFKDKNEIIKSHYETISGIICEDILKIMQTVDSGEQFFLSFFKLIIDYINKNSQSCYYIYLFADRMQEKFSDEVVKFSFNKEIDRYFKDSLKKLYNVTDLSKNKYAFHSWLLIISFIKTLAEDKIKYPKALLKDYDYIPILSSFLKKRD